MANGLKSLNKVPFVPVTAALFALVAGILVLATPQWLFERGVVSAGLPNLIAAAAPPLGEKARILAALVAAIVTGGVLWAVLTPLRNIVKPKLVERARGARIEAAGEAPMTSPVFEPNRRPIFAETDLGAPFMSDEAIAHARDELVLEPPLAEPVEVEGPAEVEATVEVEAVAEVEAGAEVEEVEAMSAPEAVAPELVEEAPVAAAPVPEQLEDEPARPRDEDSIAALMDRLENALDRREQRTGSRAPFPEDMTVLRKALGAHR